MSKQLLLLAGPLGRVIGHPGGNIRTHAGQSADQRSDHTGGEKQSEVLLEHHKTLLHLSDQVMEALLFLCALDQMGVRVGN